MEAKRDVEAWADQYLDAHRSEPRTAAPGTALDSLDDFWAERQERAARSAQRFANLEATFMLIGLVLAAAAVLAFLAGH